MDYVPEIALPAAESVAANFFKNLGEHLARDHGACAMPIECDDHYDDSSLILIDSGASSHLVPYGREVLDTIAS